MFVNDRIVGCGGVLKPRKILTECYSFGNDFIWEPAENLPVPRFNMRSSPFGSNSNIWWITGGTDETYTRVQQTWLFDGLEFVDGPLLPGEKAEHCQVTINSTHIFFTGGFSLDTFMYNIESEEWITLENAPMDFASPACGLLQNPSIGPEILVVHFARSFVFSLTDLQWRDEPQLALPISVERPSYTQLSDGFVAVGGSHSSVAYKFSQETYEWEQLEEELTTEIEYLSSVALPGEFLSCP